MNKIVPVLLLIGAPCAPLRANFAQFLRIAFSESVAGMGDSWLSTEVGARIVRRRLGTQYIDT